MKTVINSELGHVPLLYTYKDKGYDSRIFLQPQAKNLRLQHRFKYVEFYTVDIRWGVEKAIA